MKRNATIKLMIVAAPPAARETGRRPHHCGIKLKLKKFAMHRFTPNIQVLKDGSLCPPNQITAPDRRHIRVMMQAMNHFIPSSRSSI